MVILWGSADWSVNPGTLILTVGLAWLTIVLFMCCFADGGNRGPRPWKMVLLQCLGKVVAYVLVMGTLA